MPPPPVTATGALQEAGKVYADEQKALGRIERRVNEAQDIAIGAAHQMERDKETMTHIEAGVAETDEVVKRSWKQVWAILRGIARNKCFMMLGVAVLIVVVMLIIMVARGGLFGQTILSPSPPPAVVVDAPTATTVV